MTQAVFTQGSTLKHIIVMTMSSTVGLLSLFFVDLVDMYFLSLLGQKELAAAVGFSGTLLFFMIAICIAASIAMGAKVSQSLGQQDKQRAREYCVHILIFACILTTMISIPVWIGAESLLAFLGAEDETLSLALEYTHILLPSTPILAMAMGLAGALRAAGDAKRSMLAITGGGILNAVLDPILIFTLEMGIAGAAWASFLARCGILVIAGYYILQRHQLLTRPTLAGWSRDIGPIFSVAGPAMLTNLATPIGGSYVTKSMAESGDGAVAGAAIIGRLVPVAFCGLFALSGAVGPIIGQNMGAEDYRRVRQVLIDAMRFTACYVAVVWLLLYLLQNLVIQAFDAGPEAAELIQNYCLWIAPGFFFNGLLFVANASFNNMNAAYLATCFNFARSLLGTIPGVFLFSYWFGAVGVLVGEIAGALIFGTLAFWMALRKVPESAPVEKEPPGGGELMQESTACQWTYCSDKSAIGQQVIETVEAAKSPSTSLEKSL